MYIRQLLTVAALLLISVNSMPQPQDGSTPSATVPSDTPPSESGGMSSPPSGTPSGLPSGGDQRFGEWREFAGDHHWHHGPGGAGPSASGENIVPTATSVPTTTEDTTTTTDNSTTTDNTISSAAASSSAPAATAASAKLRRALFF